MDTWIKVERGIRYREHPTRRHGMQRRPDRFYVIRLAVDGVMRQEALAGSLRGLPWKGRALSLPSFGKPSVLANSNRHIQNRIAAQQVPDERERMPRAFDGLAVDGHTLGAACSQSGNTVSTFA